MSRFLVLVALAIVLAGCGGPSDVEVRSKCPDITRDLISSNIGEPTSFEVSVSDDTGGTYTEGTAIADGKELWWSCGQVIAKKGKVDVEVREGTSTVFQDIVDVP
jgi:hypothetical protein